MRTFERKANMQPGQRDTGSFIDANDINELQETLEDLQLGTVPIALSGIEGALGEYGPLQNMRAGVANVLDFGADPTGAQDSTQAIIDAQGSGHPYFPPHSNGSAAEYRITDLIPALSNRRWIGHGWRSRIVNDRSHPTRTRGACIAAGNFHPYFLNGVMTTKFAVDSAVLGSSVVTCSTTAEAENFVAGQLVFVSSTERVGGVGIDAQVPRYGQLTKVRSVDGGDIVLNDPLTEALDDGVIWALSGTDPDTQLPIYAVENFGVENLHLEGFAGFSAKTAIYGGTFRDLDFDTIYECMNTATNVVIDGYSGVFHRRMIEFAFCSRNVYARNINLRFERMTGEALLPPIVVGEQSTGIVIDGIRCHLPIDVTESVQVAYLRGRGITLRNADLQHFGTNTGVAVLLCANSQFASSPGGDILIDGGRIVGENKGHGIQIGSNIGSVDPTDYDGVTIQGTLVDGTYNYHGVWFANGRNLRCSAINQSNAGLRVSSQAEYPDLSGYRGGFS